MAFFTGVVLLFCFHMGEGAFATSALGLDRLIWLNVHHVTSLVLLGLVVHHVAHRWRFMVRRRVRSSSTPI